MGKLLISGTLLLAGALILVAILAVPAAGDPVWLPFTEHWYEYRTDAKGWGDAVLAAWQSGFVDSAGMHWAGYLATVTTTVEDAFLAQTFQEEGWLGGGDGDSDGAWTWETGPELGWIFWDNGKTLIYSNWAAGQPSGDPAEKCLLKRALVDDGGAWEAEDPLRLHGFFVEYELLAVPVPEGVETGSWGTIKRRFHRASRD